MFEFPDGWSTKRMKHVFLYSLSSVDRHVYETEKSVRVTHYPDVYNNEKITKDTCLPIGTCSDEEFNKFKLERGDILITKDSESPDDIGVPCLVEDDLENTVCGYHLGIIRKTTDIHPPFYFRYLQSEFVKGHFFCESSGITRFGLGKPSVENLIVPVPTIEEQKLISCYLDKKTNQIDSLVEKIQKKIELLKEQRSSLINHYVTKGLDPNVEMKDSGVEWIGEIPKHWDCKKLKYISNITYGISPHESTYNDEGRGTVLINGPVEYSTTDFGYTRSIKWTTDPKNMVPKGSLLFCVRGSTTGRMNICHQDVSIGRGVCSIESKLDQDFTVFSMMMIRIYIQDQISGSTFPSVVKEDVDNFILPCPPIEEQRSISKIITDKVEVIEKLIEVHSRKRDHLGEYRQSLISSVVTGKMRVTEDMV